MPQHENRHLRRQLRVNESCHISEDARRGTRLAPVRVCLDAPAPAPLVHAVHGDAALREVGEEAVVPVHVVVEAVDDDHLGLDGNIFRLFKHISVRCVLLIAYVGRHIVSFIKLTSHVLVYRLTLSMSKVPSIVFIILGRLRSNVTLSLYI